MPSKHRRHDTRVNVLPDRAVPALRSSHGLAVANDAGQRVLFLRCDDESNAAVGLGELQVATPLVALGPETVRCDPHHQWIQMTGIAADDRAGQAEHVINGADELGAGHGLPGRIALMFVKLVNDEVLKHPPQLFLNDTSRCPAVGPRRVVKQRLTALQHDPLPPKVVDLGKLLLVSKLVWGRSNDLAAGHVGLVGAGDGLEVLGPAELLRDALPLT